MVSLSSGCGGVHTAHVYRPLGPVAQEGDRALGREVDGTWYVDIDGAEVTVGSVRLSSKLVWVVGPLIAVPTFARNYVPEEGPLRIQLIVRNRRGVSTSFDPREITVELADGRTLPPITAGAARLEPVDLPERERWWGALQYDVPLLDLSPFTLHFGEIIVNGRSFRVPPISFSPGKINYSS